MMPVRTINADRKRPNPRELFKRPMRDPDLRIGLVRQWPKQQPGERGNSADPDRCRQHVDDVAQPVERSRPAFGCTGMASPDQRGDGERSRGEQDSIVPVRDSGQAPSAASTGHDSAAMRTIQAVPMALCVTISRRP